MIRILAIGPIVWLAAVLETSLAPVWSIGVVTPDVMALAALTWIFVSRHRSDPFWAGVIGFAADLIASGPIGPGMAAFALAGYGLTALRVHVPFHNPLLQTACVWFAVTLITLVITVAERLLGNVALGWSEALPLAAAVGAFTAGISLPLLLLIGWLREPLAGNQARRQTA